MDNQKQDWPSWAKYGVPTILTIIGLILGFLYFISSSSKTLEPIEGINIADMFFKMDKLGTSLEKSSFVKEYTDSLIYGKGSYLDLSGTSGGDITLFINLGGRPISCVVNANTEIERQLLLLKKGQKIQFNGLFSGGSVFGGGWYIKNCVLLKSYSDNFILRFYQIVKSRIQGF